MNYIGSYVLLPSIHSIFFVTTGLRKSDGVPALKSLTLPEFWTYKDGTRFILKRNEVSIAFYIVQTYSLVSFFF